MDITITTSELRGMADSVGLAVPKVSTSRKIKDSDFITSSELMKMNFPTMGFKGEFHGEQKWGHNCDIQMRFEDGLIIVEKNWFGETGSHKMNLSRYYKVQFNG